MSKADRESQAINNGNEKEQEEIKLDFLLGSIADGIIETQFPIYTILNISPKEYDEWIKTFEFSKDEQFEIPGELRNNFDGCDSLFTILYAGYPQTCRRLIIHFLNRMSSIKLQEATKWLAEELQVDIDNFILINGVLEDGNGHVVDFTLTRQPQSRQLQQQLKEEESKRLSKFANIQRTRKIII